MKFPENLRNFGAKAFLFLYVWLEDNFLPLSKIIRIVEVQKKNYVERKHDRKWMDRIISFSQQAHWTCLSEYKKIQNYLSWRRLKKKNKKQ